MEDGVVSLKAFLLLPFLVACSGAGRPVGPRPSETSQAEGGGGAGGAEGAREKPWSVPRLVLPVLDGSDDQDPFVTEDGLSLYFSSTRPGTPSGSNIWLVERESLEAVWGEPKLVEGINTDVREANPYVSRDKLRLWFTRVDEMGDLIMHHSSRFSAEERWSASSVLGGLGGDAKGISPSLTDDELVLYFQRDEPSSGLDIYRATRASTTEPFGQASPLAGLNSDEKEVDAFSRDDLSFVFSRGGFLRVASRSSRTAIFGGLEAVLGETAGDEAHDPWLSADGTWLVFAKQEGETNRIYEVRRE